MPRRHRRRGAHGLSGTRAPPTPHVCTFDKSLIMRTLHCTSSARCRCRRRRPEDDILGFYCVFAFLRASTSNVFFFFIGVDYMYCRRTSVRCCCVVSSRHSKTLLEWNRICCAMLSAGVCVRYVRHACTL